MDWAWLTQCFWLVCHKISWHDLRLTREINDTVTENRHLLPDRDFVFKLMTSCDVLSNRLILARTGFHQTKRLTIALSFIDYLHYPATSRNGKLTKTFWHAQMLDVRHDNLAHFIGATVNPPNVCIVSEFYSRGSLQVRFILGNNKNEKKKRKKKPSFCLPLVQSETRWLERFSWLWFSWNCTENVELRDSLRKQRKQQLGSSLLLLHKLLWNLSGFRQLEF